MKNYKALIFDMDGTLLDTLSGISKACSETFKDFGYDVSFTKDEAKKFIGAGAQEFANRAIAQAKVENLDLLKFRDSFLKYYSYYQKTLTKPFDGMSDLLKKLKNTGYIVGICSNKPQVLLNQVVEQMYPDVDFDLVVGQRDDTPCKPSKEMMEICKKELNLVDEEILYIGDSNYDYLFAKNSNVDCLILTYGYGNYQDEFMSQVTYKAGSINELEKMLNIKEVN